MNFYRSSKETRIKLAFFRWAGVIFPTQFNLTLIYSRNAITDQLNTVKDTFLSSVARMNFVCHDTFDSEMTKTSKCYTEIPSILSAFVRK